ncbi:MAG: hypothetical protein ACE5I3_10400, partial [Phycisphaerae bacterium]
MGSGTNAKTSQVRIVVSQDRLQAWMELPGSALPGSSPLGEEELISALTEKGIELTEQAHERVRQYLQIIGSASRGGTRAGRP